MNLAGNKRKGSPTNENRIAHDDPISLSGAAQSLIIGQPYQNLPPRRPPQAHPQVRPMHQGPANGNVSETTGHKPSSMVTSESGSMHGAQGDQFHIPLPPSPLLLAAQGRTRQQAMQANQKLPMLPPPVPALMTPRAHASTPNAAAFAPAHAVLNNTHALSGIQATAIGPCASGAAVKDTAAFGMMLPPISAPPPSSHPVTLAARASAVAAGGGEGHGESGSPSNRLLQQSTKEQPAEKRRTRGGSSPLLTRVASSGALRADGGRTREKKEQGLKVQMTITKSLRVTRSSAKTNEIKAEAPKAKREKEVKGKSNVKSSYDVTKSNPVVRKARGSKAVEGGGMKTRTRRGSAK